MRNYTYRDSEGNEVHKQYFHDVAGVIVLNLLENKFYITRTADIYHTLCDYRYGSSNAWIQKYPIDFSKKPHLYFANIQESKIDLEKLELSVINHFINVYGVESVRCTGFKSIEVDESLRLKGEMKEKFFDIWKSDDELKKDTQHKREQETIKKQLDDKKKKEDRRLAEKMYEKYRVESEKKYRQWCRDNGVKIQNRVRPEKKMNRVLYT
tara:strand:+ start:801 stop:1430 length:630 start_codon:yes stop_codon:yes gene_type:complete